MDPGRSWLPAKCNILPVVSVPAGLKCAVPSLPYDHSVTSFPNIARYWTQAGQCPASGELSVTYKHAIECGGSDAVDHGVVMSVSDAYRVAQKHQGLLSILHTSQPTAGEGLGALLLLLTPEGIMRYSLLESEFFSVVIVWMMKGQKMSQCWEAGKFFFSVKESTGLMEEGMICWIR